MSHVHHVHTPRHFSLPFLGFAKTAMERFINRRQMNALLKLDDYLLHDIGLTRGDVQQEALRSLWRD
jgi:uncharacterized protein YjiS (DUF1127 family)